MTSELDILCYNQFSTQAQIIYKMDEETKMYRSYYTMSETPITKCQSCEECHRTIQYMKKQMNSLEKKSCQAECKRM